MRAASHQLCAKFIAQVLHAFGDRFPLLTMGKCHLSEVELDREQFDAPDVSTISAHQQDQFSLALAQ